MRLAASVSPRVASANCEAGNRKSESRRVELSKRDSRVSTGNPRSPFWVKSPVIWLVVFTTPTVRSVSSAGLILSWPDTSISQASSVSVAALLMRGAWISDRCVASLIWVTTEPPFWAKPSWSTTLTAVPSMWAAIPNKAPTVTMPVPPTPVTSTLKLRPSGRGTIVGSGISAGSEWVDSAVRACADFIAPPSTATKLGQNPSTHE